jgi:hypothetical protein
MLERLQNETFSLSLRSFFADNLETFGDRPALITEAEATVSYAELARQADLFVTQLGTDRQLILIETANEVAPLAAYLGPLRARHPMCIYRRDESAWRLGGGR